MCQSFMFLYPHQGHNNGPKTANSNRLIWLEDPRLAARRPVEILPALLAAKSREPLFSP